MTRRRSILLFVVIGTGLTLVIAAGWVYLRASRLPAGYRPARLAPADRQRAAKDFYGRLADFNNYAQDRDAFAWSIDQKRINEYLASLDEIAATYPGRKPGTISAAMRRIGLARPAVRLGEGTITLMAMASEYRKVLSVRLAVELTDTGALRVGLRGARVGTLPIPRSLAERQLHRLRSLLQRRSGPASPPATPDAGSAQLLELLAHLVHAVDGDDVQAVGEWDGKPLRLERLEIASGRLTLRFRPL
jgi:hypothetical protein